VTRPRRDRLDNKLVVQTFTLEVAFFFGYPFLQTPVGLNPKLGHVLSPSHRLLTDLRFIESIRDQAWSQVNEIFQDEAKVP
jgi:hypothetical protein